MAPKRVLIIEGDELVRWALARELKAHRLEVTAVSSGADGRACLSAKGFDLALIDAGLPDEDGYELTGAIRDDFPDIRVIVLSSDASAASRTRAFGNGAAQLVEKPFELSEVITLARSTIEEFPNRRRYPRIYCTLALRLSVLDPTAGEEELDLHNLAGETVNVGERGLQVKTRYPLRPGQRVRVHLIEDDCPCSRLVLPDGEAVVVWARPARRGVDAGLRFTWAAGTATA